MQRENSRIKVKKGDVLQITHISFSPRRITYDNQAYLADHAANTTMPP